MFAVKGDQSTVCEQVGSDRGIQYRTDIYYTDASLLPEIEAVFKEQEEKVGAKLAVELEPLRNFFTAEEYHQKYLDNNPAAAVISRRRCEQVPVTRANSHSCKHTSEPGAVC